MPPAAPVAALLAQLPGNIVGNRGPEAWGQQIASCCRPPCDCPTGSAGTPGPTGPIGPTGPAGIGALVYEQLSVLVDGQTSFALSSPPLNPLTVAMFVNGVLAEPGASYSVTGSTVTWTDDPFGLTTIDRLNFLYQ
jgi:hypothetical protein